MASGAGRECPGWVIRAGPAFRFLGSGKPVARWGAWRLRRLHRSRRRTLDEVPASDRQWVTIVWDDPVNLMTYVTWVFQKLFGYSREKAEQLMLDVHHKGRAVVSTGARERMEHDASQLHAYGLWATVDRS